MGLWSKQDERKPLDRLIDGAWTYMGAATDAADRDARAQHATKLVATILGPLGGGDALLGESDAADPVVDNAPRETAPAPTPAVGPSPRLSQRDRDAAVARRRMNEALDDAER